MKGFVDHLCEEYIVLEKQMERKWRKNQRKKARRKTCLRRTCDLISSLDCTLRILQETLATQLITLEGTAQYMLMKDIPLEEQWPIVRGVLVHNKVLLKNTMKSLDRPLLSIDIWQSKFDCTRKAEVSKTVNTACDDDEYANKLSSNYDLDNLLDLI